MNPSQQLTAMENDVQALKALNAMNMAEHERLLGKLLLLTAQVALEAHGEFSLASKISDFLTTPFASTEGEQVSCGTVEGHGDECQVLNCLDKCQRSGEKRDASSMSGGIQRPQTPSTIETQLISSGYQAPPAGLHFASTTDEAQGHTSRVVAGENGCCVREVNPSAPEIFPRAHPSIAGNGAVFPARPQIHLCNKERRSIVRSAEERGK